MLRIYNSELGEEQEFFSLLKARNQRVSGEISGIVSDIISNVKKRGDRALLEYTAKFDHADLSSVRLSEEKRLEAVSKVSPKLIGIMREAALNITKYHEKQLSVGYRIDDSGKTVGRIVRALSSAGVYVPGGTAAYPSTVLMNCIPAIVAGVERVIITTPATGGEINPVVAAAADIVGIKEIYTVGGAQAIAALAFGTETVPAVDKIVGPGNMFVAEAKRQVFGTVDIDMIAGPSEILIIADENANPEYVAADMLSQAEHDANASSVLLTTSVKLAQAVCASVDRRLNALKRSEIASKAIDNYSAVVVFDTLQNAIKVANTVAPEHLEILTADPETHLDEIKNAGSIFIGEYAPEPMGDYFAGTNHVLPTNGSARFASPLSVDNFLKKMSYVSYTKEAFEREANQVMEFADSEGLTAHREAVKARLKSYN